MPTSPDVCQHPDAAWKWHCDGHDCQWRTCKDCGSIKRLSDGDTMPPMSTLKKG